MLYSIEHSPDKVLPEFRSFAESAARTIYSRTKQEIPRDLPWHVRPRGLFPHVLRPSRTYHYDNVKNLNKARRLGTAASQRYSKACGYHGKLRLPLRYSKVCFKSPKTHAQYNRHVFVF